MRTLVHRLPRLMQFGVYDASRVTINDDICATAKGYEYLAELNARKGISR